MHNIIWLTGIFIYCLLQIMFQSPYKENHYSGTDRISPEGIHSIGNRPSQSRIIQLLDDVLSKNIRYSVAVIPSRNEIPFTDVLPSQDTISSVDNVPSRNTVSSTDILPSRVVSGVIRDEKQHVLPYANLSYVTHENKYVTKTDGYGTYKISVPVETYGTWEIGKDGKVFKDEYTYLFHSYDEYTILNFDLHDMNIVNKSLNHIK